jgi:hypothetical protein
VSGPDEPPELRAAELLAALARHGVSFLVVGGVGCQLHGAERLTRDLDVCPEWGEDNFVRLAAALDELDARLRLPPDMGDFEIPPDARLLRRTATTHWRTRAGDVDVMLSIPDKRGRRMEFPELASRSIELKLADAEILVAALEDIIASKEHADREKDREALPELRRLLERNQTTDPPHNEAP